MEHIWTMFMLKICKPIFLCICRKFENGRNLRVLCGKFLRQKSCFFAFSDSGTQVKNSLYVLVEIVQLHHSLYSYALFLCIGYHFVSPVDKMYFLSQMYKLLNFHNRWPQKLCLILTKFVSSRFVYLSGAIVRACLGWLLLEIVASPYLAGHHM